MAMQSRDCLPGAIGCYRRAVSLDRSLHVCFADLETLRAHLHEPEPAFEHIARAMALVPGNTTYRLIRLLSGFVIMTAPTRDMGVASQRFSPPLRASTASAAGPKTDSSALLHPRSKPM